MPRKLTTTQLELFSDTQSAPVTQTPPWQSFPGDTQQTLTQLMARLFAGDAGASDGGSIMKHEKIGP